VIGGWMCRCRKYRNFRKFHKNGRAKVDHDLDMISFLTTHRRHAVELWALMRRNQHQLSSKLAEYVLSEFSSASSSHETDREKQFPGIYLFDKSQIENQDYLDSLIQKEDTRVNRRLINIFQQKD